MSLKSVLVPMTAAPIDRAALDLALALARPTDAHVEALYARRDPREAIAYAGMGTGADMVAIGPIMEQLEREGREGSERARGTFDAWRAAHAVAEAVKPDPYPHVTGGWREETGMRDQTVMQAAARADLVVCAALQSEPGPEQELLETALFGAARPVVTAPARLPADPFRHAVLAWNGSHEANRALAATLALLPRFETLHVFCRAESHRAAAFPNDAVELLAWHGVKAQVLSFGASKASGEAIGAELLKAAQSVDASFLIMGAYTHGRVRQMVFGGATHHILHHAAMPVLLVH